MRIKAKNETFNQKVMRLLSQVQQGKILPIDAWVQICKLHEEELDIKNGRI
jgi:hypothetical protein